MKHQTILVLFAILSLVAIPAFGQTIVQTFPAPDNYAWGLAWADGYLWVTSGTGSNETFSKLDPADGTVLSVIPDPGIDVQGLGYDGTYLLGADEFGGDDTGAILSIDPADGTLVSYIEVPGDYLGGCEWDGNYIWYTKYHPNDEASIIAVDPNDGTVQRSLPAPETQPYGLAWDGSTFWVADEDSARISQIDPDDGTVLFSFESPSPGASELRGMCWDGQYLWLVDNDVIYKIDLGGSGTADIDIPTTTHDFGPTIIGETATWDLYIQNVGTAPLSITAMNELEAPFDRDALTFPFTIEAGADTTVEITFNPQFEGFFSEALEVESDDPDEGLITIELDGQGLIAEPQIVLSSNAHNYGTVQMGAALQWELEISNHGMSTLNITNMAFDDTTSHFSFPDYIYPILIPSWQSTVVPITYHPMTTGNHSIVLEIDSNDPANPQVTVNLSGNSTSETQFGGTTLWAFQCPEDVNVIADIEDIDGDGLNDAIAESYDAGSDGDHLFALKGNSYESGILLWSADAVGGPSQSGGYGNKCMAIMPDVDGDGVQDIISGTAWGGRTIQMVSGATGVVIWYYDTYTDPYGSGWVYAVDQIRDVTGDGVPDVIAGTGSSEGGTQGKVAYCFDSVNGDLLWSYQAPDGIGDVEGIDDVNNDGVYDAVFVTGTNGTAYHAICISGASEGTGVPLWSVTSSYFIYSVITISDITNDGKREVVFGDWDGNLTCINAQSGLIEWNQNVNGGIMQLQNMGDISGDGKADIIVAPGGNFAPTTRFQARDGSTGNLLWDVYTGGSVWAVSSVGDLNGDGIREGLGGSFDGQVYCASGADGSVLWTSNVGAKVFTLSSIADISNDGWPDVLAGTQYLSAGGGRAFAIEGGDESVPVDLLSFDGEMLTTGVRLAWDMLSWNEVAGFNVYRKTLQADSQTLQAQYERIKSRLLPNLPRPDAILQALSTEVNMATYDSYERLNSELIVEPFFVDERAQPGQTDLYQLGKVDSRGIETLYDPITVTYTPDGNVADFGLSRNYPNPFADHTAIHFQLAKPGPVTVTIYNMAGQVVRTLLDDQRDAGQYSLNWDGTNALGESVNSGVYFYRLTTGDHTETQRMVLMR